MIDGSKKLVKGYLHMLAEKIFYFKCIPFPTIVSSDCFGGEIYRALKIQYNTPFVGLGMMAPCYINFLRNIEFYLSSELTFSESSKYDNINRTLTSHGKYPIGYLNGEIEIQFVHYKTHADAKNKWEQRKRRMDLNNLFVKYDYSKDYSTDELLIAFLQLEYKSKLAIGSLADLPKDLTHKHLTSISNYHGDGTVLFKNSLREIDYSKLLKANVIVRPNSLKGSFLSKWLSPGYT